MERCGVSSRGITNVDILSFRIVQNDFLIILIVRIFEWPNAINIVRLIQNILTSIV